MVIRTPVKFGCARLTLSCRLMNRNQLLTKCYPLRRLSYVTLNPARACHQRHLDIERLNDRNKEIPLPMLIYVYSPLQLLSLKYNLWKLKLLWDWRFDEAEFVDNAERAMVVLNKFILEKRTQYIKRCTTPMGYKQIKYDLFQVPMYDNWPAKLMCFEKRHIYRSITLKVQRLEYYNHKFAFVDMIFLACRRTNDFDSKWQEREMRNLIAQFAVVDKLLVPDPLIFAEYFVRFRRDYSLPVTVRAGHWLISSYKILQLDVLNSHPDFDAAIAKRRQQLDPLSPGLRVVKNV